MKTRNVLILMILTSYFSSTRPDIFSVTRVARLAARGMSFVTAAIREGSNEFSKASKGGEPISDVPALGH